MKLAFIGDVHGHINEYLGILKFNRDFDQSFQLGDMGIGFRNCFDHLQVDPLRDRFIHGNHDNPDLCKIHPAFLGRYGYVDVGGVRIFFVSGGYSIDKHHRTLGVNYWDNEELSYREAEELLKIYSTAKADIVITHDCPMDIRHLITGTHHQDNSYTPNLLSEMFWYVDHKPKYYFFGHHHHSFTHEFRGTTFRCLAELEKYVLEV